MPPVTPQFLALSPARFGELGRTDPVVSAGHGRPLSQSVGRPRRNCWHADCCMDRGMIPLPTALATASPTPAAPTAPQSLLVTGTTADSRSVATAFIDQLTKLLPPAAPATKPIPPEAAATQPAPRAAAAAQPDAGPVIANVPPQATLAQLPQVTPAQVPQATPAQLPQATLAQLPQVNLPQLPIVALASQQADPQPVQPRSLGISKPKVVSTTPKHHPSATSDQPAPPTPAALPAPDAIVAPTVPASATPDRMAPSGPHSGQAGAGGEVRHAGSATKLEAPTSGTADVDRPQPQDAPPMQVVAAEPPADTSATAALPAAPLGAAPPISAAETTAAPTRTPEPAPAPATSAMAHPGSPAAQITPALMQTGQGPDGAQRLTVRLDPPELGHVQIKIDRPSDAPARVEITVEKHETLSLLLRDQPQLQRALDQAGVPADGRTVTFHVAAAGPSIRADSGTTPIGGAATGGLTGDGSHGATGQHGKPAHQGHAATDEDGDELTPAAARGWLRAGLDITA